MLFKKHSVESSVSARLWGNWFIMISVFLRGADTGSSTAPEGETACLGCSVSPFPGVVEEHTGGYQRTCLGAELRLVMLASKLKHQLNLGHF